MKIHLVKNLLAVCLLTFIFFSCSEEETITYQLNSKLVQLKCDKTFALQISPALDGLTYTSLNTNIATVSNNGLIKAKLVGTTKIVVKDPLNRFVDTVKVEVTTMFTSFANPFLTFGAGKDAIYASIDLHKYEYYYYPYESYNYLYMYDKTTTTTTTTTYRTYYYYYLSKDDKLILSNVYLHDDGELDGHFSSRYNNMRTFSYSSLVTSIYLTETEDGYDTTYVTSTYSNVDSYFINPDSSLVILKEKSTTGSYADIYYLEASKENIQRILNTDEDDGKRLFYWIYYSKLYPNGEVSYLYESPEKKADVSTMKRMPKFRQPMMLIQPEKSWLPEKQLHGIVHP